MMIPPLLRQSYLDEAPEAAELAPDAAADDAPDAMLAVPDDAPEVTLETTPETTELMPDVKELIALPAFFLVSQLVKDITIAITAASKTKTLFIFSLPVAFYIKIAGYALLLMSTKIVFTNL